MLLSGSGGSGKETAHGVFPGTVRTITAIPAATIIPAVLISQAEFKLCDWLAMVRAASRVFGYKCCLK